MTRSIDAFIDTALLSKSDATRRSYRYSLNRFLAYLEGSGGDIDNLTRTDVQMYISHLQTVRKLTASSVLREYAAVAAFAHWSGQDHALRDLRLPTAPKTLALAPKSLEKNDRNRLLRDVERDGNLRNTAIINVMLRTGLRVSEMVALDKADVVMGAREESSYLIVRSGKGNKERRVPLVAEARHVIREYLATRVDNCEALYVTEKGAPRRISVRQVQALCAKYSIHPHLLRHSRARSLVDAGVDLFTVADVLGHASLDTTRRYAKPSFEQVAKALERADDF